MTWQTKKLGEVCDLKSGTTISTQREKISGPILYVKVGDMNMLGNEVCINTSSRFVDKNSIKQNQVIPEGSIIFPKRGGAIFTNKRRKIVKPTIVDLNIMALVPSKAIDANFLYYWFLGINLADLNNGSSIPQINNYSFDNTYISFPELHTEQQRIVAILDKVFAGIEKATENTKKNLKNAKELFESHLQSVFVNPGKDWEEKTLGELGQITSSKRIFKKEYVNSGIPFYRIKEIKELANQKHVSTDLYISESRYLEIKGAFGVPKAGDLLMTAVGTIGEIYVVKKDHVFYFKDGNVLWFKDFGSINSRFLKLILVSFVEKIKKLSIGSAYNALTIEKLARHKILIPSLSEQDSIVAEIDGLSTKTKKLEAIYQQKLLDLEELKRSVLKQAFAGEL